MDTTKKINKNLIIKINFMEKKSVLEVYQEVLQRAEELKDREMSGDGYLELHWVAEQLEKTEEVNPTKKD